MPNFLFADTPDPIALAQTTAQLSRHFQRQSQTAYAFSNGLMSQVAAMRPTARPAPAAGGGDLGPRSPAPAGTRTCSSSAVRA